MEFNKKLQELRRQKGLTQEELAESLYVSRTAISKWESGRGYPNIDSLKSISNFFNVTIDELLSGDEVLSIAEDDSKQKEMHFRSILFGLCDLCVIILFFIPLFGQKTDGIIRSVSLFSLEGTASYLKILYYILTCVTAGYGVITLAFQNCQKVFWLKSKNMISLILNIASVLLFIVSSQPYVASFLFIFLILKVSMLIKRQ